MFVVTNWGLNLKGLLQSLSEIISTKACFNNAQTQTQMQGGWWEVASHPLLLDFALPVSGMPILC